MTITFKNEEERTKAIDAVPEIDEAPSGKNIDEFKLEIEQQLDDISNAEITDKPPVEEKIIEPIEKVVLDDPEKKIEKKPEEKPEELSIEDKIRLLRDRNQSHIQPQSDKTPDKIVELEKTIKALEAKIDKPKTKVEPEEFDKNIEDIQSQISLLEKEMNEVDEEEEYTEVHIKNLRKTTLLNSKLNSLLIKKSKEDAIQRKAEIDEINNKSRLDKEKSDIVNSRKNTIKAIEKFRKGKPEFKGRAYDEMDSDYVQFGKKVASVWYGKAESRCTKEEVEIAVGQYLDKVPALVNSLEKRGVKEPEDLNMFINLSEINALKMGHTMNKSTGEWVPIRDSAGRAVNYLNLDSAYNEIKNLTANSQLDIDKAKLAGAKEVARTIGQRTNPTELDDSHTGTGDSDLNKAEALKIIETYDEEKAIIGLRKNPADPYGTMLNKAFKFFNLAPLDV